MGSYQRLQGVFDVYNQKVTAARNGRQMSLTDLADAAGIGFLSRRPLPTSWGCRWMSFAALLSRATSRS